MNKKLWISFSLVILTGMLGVFHRQVFPIQKVEIQGANLIKPQVIEKLVDKKESLLSLNREKLAKTIKTMPLVDEVHISRKLFNRIRIKIKEKNVVALIYYKDKKYYLTSKGIVLSEKTYVLKKDFPKIILKKKVNTSRLISISGHLGILKFHDQNFFKKISEISLQGTGETNIFIDSKKQYILNSNPKLEDLLKIRFLEQQNLKHRIMDLRGNYIIVRK